VQVSALAVALTLFTSTVAAQRPIPNGTVRSGTLSFDGHATAGDFTGTTTSVDGNLTGGPQLTAARGWVEAPVTTLVTGNDRRDKDLNKSMESDKYPTIRFDLDSLAPSWERGDSAAVLLHGRLALHGVVRPRALEATIVFRPDETIQLQSAFPVNLKEHRIGGLSKFLGEHHMHEDIQVRVDHLYAPRP
jgi:polyisoprenoid-binding protein YceI